MTLKWYERPLWGVFIGGIVMLVVTVGFVITALTQPMLRTSFLITAAIMGILAIFMIRLGWPSNEEGEDDERIREAGLRGQATIEAVEPTGQTIRKQPEMRFRLRLRLPGHPDYVVTETSLVPEEAVGRMTPGRTVNVISDPKNVLKVVFDWDNLEKDVPHVWGEPPS